MAKVILGGGCVNRACLGGFFCLGGSLTISFCPFREVFLGDLFFLGAFLLREETFPMSTIHWGYCLSFGALELITFPITLLSRRPRGFFLGLAVRALAKFHFNK